LQFFSRDGYERTGRESGVDGWAFAAGQATSSQHFVVAECRGTVHEDTLGDGQLTRDRLQRLILLAHTNDAIQREEPACSLIPDSHLNMLRLMLTMTPLEVDQLMSQCAHQLDGPQPFIDPNVNPISAANKTIIHTNVMNLNHNEPPNRYKDLRQS